jgi:hypothetical protein
LGSGGHGMGPAASIRPELGPGLRGPVPLGVIATAIMR